MIGVDTGTVVGWPLGDRAGVDAGVKLVAVGLEEGMLAGTEAGTVVG